MSAIRSQQVSH